MTAKSYKGPTQEWTCPECDNTTEIACDEFRDGLDEPDRVYCKNCEERVPQAQ